MKTIHILAFLIIYISLNLRAQDTVSFEYDDTIKKIENILKILNNEVPYIYIINKPTPIKEYDSSLASIKRFISDGDSIFIRFFSASGFYNIKYKIIEGWISEEYIPEIYKDKLKRIEKYSSILLELNTAKDVASSLKKDNYYKAQVLLKEKRDKKTNNEYILKKYGKKIGTIIINHKIYINMPRNYLILSWGAPHNINKSVGSWGVHEQFIYDKSYVYIENGFVTSWQIEE